MLVPLQELLGHARRNEYAVGYFEAWDSYSVEAVAEAAARESSPVILGFGCLMVDRAWLDQGGIDLLGNLGRLVAEQCPIPVSLLLNEAQTLEQAEHGLRAGFNAIMLDTSTWPRDEAVAAVSRFTKLAHAAGVAVEAELGHLPDATASGIDASTASLTDPDEAAAFVEQTGVDCLAVSIGNIHRLTDSDAPVDMERLSRIHERIDVPFVIHGGTGFPLREVRRAITLGVAKFNVGTTLKRAFLDGILTRVGHDIVDVHAALGSHKEADILVAGKEPMCLRVQQLMDAYGSSGRANSK